MAKLDQMGITFVATGSRDKTIKIWDAIRGICLWTFVCSLSAVPSTKHYAHII
jgi:WD40 repeat protein